MLPEEWQRSDPAVISLGLTAQDHIWTVDSLPAGMGKHRASGFDSTGGGMAATAAVAIAVLGGRSHFWGRAGQDAAGHAMRRELALEGVDVEQFRLFPGARSSVSGVLVDRSGERLIVNFRGAELPVDPAWLPDNTGDAGAVLADPRWPEGARHLFSLARARGIPTVLDADVAEPQVFRDLLPLTDHAIFSQQALEEFAGGDLQRVADHGCRVAAVTRGDEGVEWLEGGQTHRQPAFTVEVVDTTGAGDVFHGAWALAIAAGVKTAHAAGFAAAAAALKCTRPGGRAGIPNLNDTVALWRSTT